MRKYAMVDNNIVTEILMLDEEMYRYESTYHNLIIDIEDETIEPQVGWKFNGSKLVPNASDSLSLEEVLRFKIKQARIFGTELVAEMTDRIGAKNLLAGKSESEVIAIVTLLDPIKKLLEGGAITTALTQTQLAKTGLMEFAVEFDYAIDRMQKFLQI